MSCLSVRSACASEVEDEFLPHDIVTRSELKEYDKAYREYVKREYAPEEHAKKLKIAREYIRDYSLSGFHWVFDEPRDRHLVFTVCKALRALLEPNGVERMDRIFSRFEFKLGPDDVVRVLRRNFGWSDFHFRWLDNEVLSKDLDIMRSLGDAGDRSQLYLMEYLKARLVADRSLNSRNWLETSKLYRKYPTLCLAMKEVQHIMMPERKKDIRYKIGRFFDQLRVRLVKSLFVDLLQEEDILREFFMK
ncbi:hypothetical protein V3565_05000 [Bartonella sp. B10]